MTRYEQYTAAADLIERGWAQGVYISLDGQRGCLVSALNRAVGAPGDSPYVGHAQDLVVEVNDYLKRHSFGYAIRGSGRSLIRWNDAPGRTQEEVVRLLRTLATRHLADHLETQLREVTQRIEALEDCLVRQQLAAELDRETESILA